MLNLGVHSWSAFIAKASERLYNPPVHGAGTSSQSIDEETNGVDFETALKMGMDGWPDGAKQIASVLDTLPPSLEVLPDWMMNVAGAICNVPAFIAGEPECMWNLSDNRRDERRITLIIQASYPHWVDSNTAMNYAIAVAANVRSLEASGINPAVLLLAHRRHPKQRHITSGYGVFVREYGEPLDLAKIAFTFHPAFLRRVDRAWREGCDLATRAGINYGNYGVPLPYGIREVQEVFVGEDVGSIAVIRGIKQLADEGLLIDKDYTPVTKFINLIQEDIIAAVARMI